MRGRKCVVLGLLLAAVAAAGAEEGEAVDTLRSEAARLHAELVLLRRIRAAQRELIEWARATGERRVRGLPPGICRASALRGLCPRLGLTFSVEEEAQ